MTPEHIRLQFPAYRTLEEIEIELKKGTERQLEGFTKTDLSFCNYQIYKKDNERILYNPNNKQIIVRYKFERLN